MNLAVILIFVLTAPPIFAQSRRAPNFSESGHSARPAAPPKAEKTPAPAAAARSAPDDNVIRIETDLIVVPVQIGDREGNPVVGVGKAEFKIFENDIEQEIAFFSAAEQPFTVALVLDMSYSSAFKLAEIQQAALAFVNQLREKDRVMVVSFDEQVRILCEPTANRQVLRLAIEGAEIASGTSLYAALDMVLRERMRTISGRKAVVLLSDAVDTSSRAVTAADVLRETAASGDVLIYPIQYDTYDDVRQSRKKDAPIFYDEDDRPYAIEKPPAAGERQSDYEAARDFARMIARQSGGRVYPVSSKSNLNQAFAKIVDELRNVYSIGYYPNGTRETGARYDLRVRVYRPNLMIRARPDYVFLKKNAPAP